MIRVVILSFWHVHAKDYAQQALAHPDTEIAAIWDEVPERGRQKAAEYGVPFYERLDDVLALPDVDGVIVVTPTNRHREVMIAAAEAGKHIFTEKVLALTTPDCEAIMAAVRKSEVKLTVSLPRLNMGFTQAVNAILQAGQLGQLTLVRLRLAHNGALPTETSPLGSLPAHFFSLEQAGGGALMDLGCHPMYLARLFLGMPESVQASFGYVTGKEVEDSAVAVLRYPDGALGIVEAGFVNSYSQFNLEIQGTLGSLSYSRQDDKLYVRGVGFDGAEKAWRNWTELPSALPSSFEQWVTHIQQGTTADENIQLALDLTRLMEASVKSAQSGGAVSLCEFPASGV
ncbi:Gfo/Idh/MocA family protein [Paenibacillus ferrarius]|uniref:Gfo/Idh/MocA family protein n=1 Tax=Paenibacillus ferrarius TaxID=1469647 RepID=UPI003D2E946F